RCWDRSTPDLLEKLRGGQSVHVYRWDAQSRDFREAGKDEQLIAASIPQSREVTMKAASPAQESAPDQREFRASWRSVDFPFDPKIFRFVVVKLKPVSPQLDPEVPIIELSWVSQRSSQWTAAKVIRVYWPLHDFRNRNAEAELWLYPGRRVDWVLGGRIVQLQITSNRPIALEQLQLTSAMPEIVSMESEHIEEYTFPKMKFLWESESWWRTLSR